MRRTKIVATIGPATAEVSTLVSLIEAGLNVARVNLSHGDPEQHRRLLENVRLATAEVGRPVGRMIDTRGPEIRVGPLAAGAVQLDDGSQCLLVTGGAGGQAADDVPRLPVDYPALARTVAPAAPILLDDGNIMLTVEEIQGEDAVLCRVVSGGLLEPHKKVTLPGVSVDLPALTDEDVADIRRGVALDIDFIAVSFVRKPDDILVTRRLIEELGGDQAIIAKIESEEGVENLEAVLQVADGIMVARGDLGVEMPTEEVPLIQKEMIAACNRMGKPVITATQMLESMVERPRPTRAEASDVANAILDGTDAVMLSAETAVGRYPVESVAIMAKIAERTEQALDDGLPRSRLERATVTDAISQATCVTAARLDARAIVTATHSGHTARMVSKHRPQALILAATPNAKVVQKLTLVWGVYPILVKHSGTTDETIEASVEGALDSGFVRNGDLVVLTAGIPAGVPGTTNLLKVHTVGRVLLRGTGIGERAVTGRVRMVPDAAAARQLEEGEILVSETTDRDFMPWLERARALIVTEAGLTSHGAVMALHLGIPAIVGARKAQRVLESGQTVTVDPMRGLVYEGEATVL